MRIRLLLLFLPLPKHRSKLLSSIFVVFFCCAPGSLDDSAVCSSSRVAFLYADLAFQPAVILLPALAPTPGIAKKRNSIAGEARQHFSDSLGVGSCCRDTRTLRRFFFFWGGELCGLARAASLGCLSLQGLSAGVCAVVGNSRDTLGTQGFSATHFGSSGGQDTG